MSTLKVIPVYGWGWSENDLSIEVPSAFEIEIIKSDGDCGSYRAVFGKILSGSITFTNCYIILTLGNFKIYDVQIYEKLNETEIPEDWYPKGIPILATGFAEISFVETSGTGLSI